MSDNDNYYRQRIDEELVAAEGAGDPAVANIHRDLARRYRELLETRLRVVPVPPEAATRAVGFQGA